MLKWDTVIKHESGKHFRYNSDKCLLEYVTLTDIVWSEDGEDLITVPLAEPEVLEAWGLSKESAEDGLEYWMDEMSFQLDEEARW